MKMTSTGFKVSVFAGLPATLDAAGYRAVAWVPCGELIDFPSYGPTITPVESNPLATGITETFPGFVSLGELNMGFDIDFMDVGQQVLEAGLAIPPAPFVIHSVKMEFPDGTTEFSAGGIFSYTRDVGSANSMIGSQVMFRLNKPIIRILPTP